MTDDNDVYTPAQFREHQDGYGVRDADSHPHTGIVRDPLVSRFLSIQQEAYDPEEMEKPGRMPGTADGLQETQQIRSVAATETGRQALKNGDMPTLKHLTGDQNERADISGMKAIQKIDKIIENPAPVIVILGEMGTGKTNLAGLIGQRAKYLLGIEQVGSNIPTLKETTEWIDEDGDARSGFVPGFKTLDEWVKQDGDPLEVDQSPKLFIGDEFSSVGDGGGKSGYLMRKKMGPLVFKIRKYNGLLIYIAHDESSIHPLLWRLGVVIKKTSKKQAIIADKIKSGEVRDVQATIDGVPPTDWRYNDKDPAVWSWTGTEDDEEPEPGSVAWDCFCYTAIMTGEEMDLSTRQAADSMPFQYRWIAERRREYEQENMHRDLVHRVESWTA